MKLPRAIPPYLYNKYLLATVGYLVWMLFFDRNDIFIQHQRREELKALQKNQAYFIQQIAAERKFSEDLKKDPAAIEKFAREHYKMKRAGEDLFVIARPSPAEGD